MWAHLPQAALQETGQHRAPAHLYPVLVHPVCRMEMSQVVHLRIRVTPVFPNATAATLRQPSMRHATWATGTSTQRVLPILALRQ